MTNTLTAILFTVLLMAGTLPARAQHQHGQQRDMEQAQVNSPSQGGMMQGDMTGTMQQMNMGMMDQAVHDPFQHSAMLVRVLPTMKAPLGLSDEQVARLEEEAGQFKRLQSALRDKAAEAESQLKDLLASDKPDPVMVKSKMREAATHRADIKSLGYATANWMKAGFTEEQRVTLAEMTPMQMHHHMATHMTMMEMMKAMHGDMMPGSMMEMMKAMKEDGTMKH